MALSALPRPAPRGSKLSRVQKIALPASFLGFVTLIVCLLLHLPLPTIPFLNLSGGKAPEYVFFMSNTPENIPGSAMFAVLCFLVFVSIFAARSHEKGSLRNALREMRDEIIKDFTVVLGESKPKPPNGNGKAAAPHAVSPTYTIRRATRTRPPSQAPETSP